MMHRPTPRARALLDKLQERWGGMSFPRSGAQGQEALVMELGATGEPVVIPVLVPLLLRGSEREARAVAVALHRLVWLLGPEDVLALDEALRARGYWLTEWSDLKPEALGRFASMTPGVMALFTSHPNGYVREAALRALRGRSGGHAWPFLLVRLNDWVAPVREVALTVASEALGDVEPGVLARHLPLLTRLEHLERTSPRDFMARARERLRAPDVRAWMRANLGGLPREARRVAYRLLLEPGAENLRALAEQGLEDPDVWVRGFIAGQVGALFEGEVLRALLERMRRSRTAPVRREGYVLCAQRFPDVFRGELRAALCDTNRMVREFTQYRLKGTVDVAALYRESLEEPPRLRGALAGLGETGQPLDALRVEPYLTHPRVGVRREAVRAFARLGGEEVVERLREAFADPAPSVTRAVAAELARGSGRVSLGWLRRWLGPEVPEGVRRAAVGLWPVLPHWDGPLLLVEASGVEEEPLRERVDEELGYWMASQNRRFVAPTGEQLRALRAAVRSAPRLSESRRASLEHLLRAFEPF